MLKQFQITIDTTGRGIFDITDVVAQYLHSTKVDNGLCNIFIHHTSASLIICENADPQVQKDLDAFMQRLVPDGDELFKHTQEGDDDMPAHVRTILTTSFLTIPISDCKLGLGTWQGIYVWEHRLKAYKRKLTITILDGGTAHK